MAIQHVDFHAYSLTEQQLSLVKKAEQLNLNGVAFELNEQFGNDLEFNKLSFEERIKKCFEQEEIFYREALFQRNFKTSRLPRKIYFSSLVEDHTRISAKDLTVLKELNYIGLKKNVILMGPTGVGKTAIATAAGIEALKRGYKVLYYRMNDFVAYITAKSAESFKNFTDKLKRIHMLIIDDYGHIKLSETALIRFNEIVAKKYGFGSIVLTTQLQREGLSSVVDGEFSMKEALMDRLLNNNTICISLKGKSLRGSESEALGDQGDL